MSHTRNRFLSASRLYLFTFLLTAGLAAFAWGQAAQTAQPAKSKPAAKKKAPATAAAPAEVAVPDPGSFREPLPDPATLEAAIRTDTGTIVIRFFPDVAPNHVRYFLNLARQGFYDGTSFFRLIRYGIIQGGDPLGKDPAARARWGTGGLNKLKAEFNARPCQRGAVAAVLVPGKPDSAGTQFFICVTDQVQLNGQYTVFGQVVSGMHVVEQISALPVDDKSTAVEPAVIRQVEVRPIPVPAFRDAPVEKLQAQRAVIVTSLGEIELEFYPDIAPNHVRHFLSFAAAGLYNGTDFHRVVPGFVIQGGALYDRQPPLDEEFKDWLQPLKAEFSDRPHLRGTLSMARATDPDSAVDSFYICLAPQPRLDGKYTVFGRVVRGMEVVDQIAAVPCDGEKPRERVEIKEIRVQEAPQP
jgi:peptidyl-prolyl cis-trans isomerase B (cyclophilin B)